MAERIFSLINASARDHQHFQATLPSQLSPLAFTSMSANRDEVDRLIAAWKRERPDLDLSPFAVLSRISRISRNLDIARRDAFADLETWGFDVLAALRRAGDPYQLSPGELMQETLVTSGTMTNRLDRLEELKLITRQPDPDDGRGSLVTLTASGMRAVDKALDGLLEHERDLLKGLTREQRVALADLLSVLAAHLEES
jgi:DNA-binding MarR family transcriptional regulator